MISFSITSIICLAYILVGLSEALLFVKGPSLVTVVKRSDFMAIVTRGLTDSAIASVLLHPSASYARGRATLEQSYDRYASRIITGGVFYKNDFKKAMDKNDWAFLKVGSPTNTISRFSSLYSRYKSLFCIP